MKVTVLRSAILLRTILIASFLLVLPLYLVGGQSASALSCAIVPDPLTPLENMQANTYVFKARVESLDDIGNSSSAGAQAGNAYTISITDAAKGVTTGETYTLYSDDTWGARLQQGEEIIGIFNSLDTEKTPPQFSEGLCEAAPRIIMMSGGATQDKYDAAFEQVREVQTTTPQLNNERFIMYAAAVGVLVAAGMTFLLIRKRR